MSKTYRIETVEDFLKVPPDRRPDCLHEFEVWLACFDLAVAIAEGSIKRPFVFQWIDDGLRKVSLTLQNGSERVVLATGQMKARQ